MNSNQWAPVQVETCVITRLSSRGSGIVGDPYRTLTQVWTLKGELIAEYDPTCDPASILNQERGAYPVASVDIPALSALLCPDMVRRRYQ